MARPWRIQYPEAVYHVTARGNERRKIFRGDGDREDFLALLGRAAGRFNLHVLAFCLMDNHYHLFVRTPDANLSAAMHWLNATYTIRFNLRHHRVGHLLQGRFKAVLVTEDSHWSGLSFYLHLNPVRAGLVDDPAAYAWSSFRDFTGANRFPWLRPQQVLAAFGPGQSAARRRYRKACLEHSDRPAAFWEEIRAAVILGPREALEELAARHGPRGDSREVTEFRSASRAGLDPAAELARVARVFGLAPAELAQRRRNFPPRLAAYYHLVENCGFSVAQTATLMQVHSPAVTLGIKRLKHAATKDRRLASQLKSLNKK